MRYYNDCELYEYWEDNDNQDGTYFRDYEKPYEKEYTLEGERELTHVLKKHNAALYIRLHLKELIKDEVYKKAYYKIIDEFAREEAYIVDKKPLLTVSDEERELEGLALDFEILVLGKRNVEKYKEDAIYIVNLIGKRI